MPKLKYSKEQIKRMSQPVVKSVLPGDRQAKVDRSGDSIDYDAHPTVVQQYCNNCGGLRKFKVDGLGYKTCTTCFSRAQDRSKPAT